MFPTKTLSTLFGFACSWPMCVSAEETTPSTYEWKNTWSSAFSRSVGGSQTAHAFNEDALFANPAALNKTRHPRSKRFVDVVDAPGLSIGGNRSAVADIKAKALKPADWLKTFGTQSTSSRSYLETQLLPWAVMGERGGPTFFVALPVRSTLVATPSLDEGLTRHIATATTAAAALNMSFSTRSGAAAFGLTLRPNVRWNSSATYTLADIGSSKGFLGAIKSDAYRTTSTAVDVGLIVTAGDFWLPTFGLAILNAPAACVDDYINPATGKTQSICGAKRVGNVNDSIQETRLDPTEIRMGFSIVPRMRVGGQRLNLKISGDIYPLPISTNGKNYGLTDININQLTHAGVELFLGNALSSRSFSIRGGLNETRVSWGFSLPLPHFNLEMSSYEAAVFTDGKASKDRRYLLGLSSHW